ncbi:MAG: hypothetical protein ACLT16_10460 [[Clostridium] innocuum]
MQKAVHDLCVEAFDQLQLLSIYALVKKEYSIDACAGNKRLSKKNSSCICLKNINKRLEHHRSLFLVWMKDSVSDLKLLKNISKKIYFVNKIMYNE